MRRHGTIELDWADGTYSFRLSLEGIEELEERRDVSLFALAKRLAEREARLADIREVIRIGLIGGGMQPADALGKLRRYLDERPMDDNRDTAYAVALAGLMRVYTLEKETDQGEADAAKSKVASTSPPSEVAPS